MTTLFGGFGNRFYAAYDHLLPPEPGRELRRDLYNLYHVLNHALLFGGGYAAQAQTTIDRLAA
jgi:fructosamine-3-kinase